MVLSAGRFGIVSRDDVVHGEVAFSDLSVSRKRYAHTSDELSSLFDATRDSPDIRQNCTGIDLLFRVSPVQIPDSGSAP